jgi:hypothetical protein
VKSKRDEEGDAFAQSARAISQGFGVTSILIQKSCCETGGHDLHVIASEAKQSSFLRRDKKAGLLRRCRSS